MGRRWISYSRVSDDRNQGRSVEEQDAENHRTAERLGDEIVASLVDNSVGASRYSRGERPEWQKAVLMLERHEADGIMTWEASRATRDLEMYVKLRRVCRDTGALWCYNGRVYDLNDDDDSFSTLIDIGVSEREVGATRKRVMRATLHNAERGLPHGKLLFGYKRNYSGNGVFIEQVPDEAQAAIFIEAATRALNGDLDQWIVNDFKARGLTTGRGAQWSLSQLKRMLMNPGYAGLRVHQGEVIGKAIWPGLITEEQHYQILARYESKKLGRRHDTAIKYLLTGIAECGVCGGLIAVNKPRGYPSYHCRAKFCVARKIWGLDELITDLVLARLSQPDILADLAVDNEPALEAIDELSKLRTRLDGFYAAAASGEITPNALSRIEASLLPQIERYEAKARRVNVPGTVHDLIVNPRAIWPTLNIIEQREVVRLLMRIQICRTRKGERTLDPSSVRITWLNGATESEGEQ